MSKEIWLEAYERVYNSEEAEFLTEDQIVEKANSLAQDIESSKIDAAMERMKYDKTK